MATGSRHLIASIANKVKASPSLVQGAGGNISVKFGKTMLIKASGTTLSDTAGGKGISELEHGRISQEYLLKKNPSEKKVAEILGKCLAPKSPRPSLEVGFHAFLGKVVIHLHPIYLNAILCSKNARRLLGEAFPREEYSFVPYCQVGHRLASRIAESVRDRERRGLQVHFLGNHGLVVSGDSPRDCVEKSLMIAKNAESFVVKSFGKRAPYSGLKKASFGSEKGLLGQTVFQTEKFLFPDAIVFVLGLKEGKGGRILQNGKAFYTLPNRNARMVDETIYAHNELMRISESLGGAKLLSKKDVSLLYGMDAEKHRRAKAGL